MEPTPRRSARIPGSKFVSLSKALKTLEDGTFRIIEIENDEKVYAYFDRKINEYLRAIWQVDARVEREFYLGPELLKLQQICAKLVHWALTKVSASQRQITLNQVGRLTHADNSMASGIPSQSIPFHIWIKTRGSGSVQLSLVARPVLNMPLDIMGASLRRVLHNTATRPAFWTILGAGYNSYKTTACLYVGGPHASCPDDLERWVRNINDRSPSVEDLGLIYEQNSPLLLSSSWSESYKALPRDSRSSVSMKIGGKHGQRAFNPEFRGHDGVVVPGASISPGQDEHGTLCIFLKGSDQKVYGLTCGHVLKGKSSAVHSPSFEDWQLVDLLHRYTTRWVGRPQLKAFSDYKLGDQVYSKLTAVNGTWLDLALFAVDESLGRTIATAPVIVDGATNFTMTANNFGRVVLGEEIYKTGATSGTSKGMIGWRETGVLFDGHEAFSCYTMLGDEQSEAIIQNGDSGALVISASSRLPIGLLFGRSTAGNFGFFNALDVMMATLEADLKITFSVM